MLAVGHSAFLALAHAEIADELKTKGLKQLPDVNG
jgi:hypothetical protein